MTPTQAAIICLKNARSFRKLNNPLSAYALFKRCAKLIDGLAESIKDAANGAYMTYTAEHGDGPFELEGCMIKRYTKAPTYTYPKEINDLEAEVKVAQAKLKIQKELAVKNKKAKLVPEDEDVVKTIFTVTVSK